MKTEDLRDRFAEVERETKETNIALAITLDAAGLGEIKTGIGFFDHMLNHIAYQSKIDLSIQATGDIEVDEHHTVEDIGICFGKALHKALGNKRGIERYGWVVLPMDEALVMVSMDFSGRTFLSFEVTYTRDHIGGMSTEMIEEFFRAVCQHAGLTLHIKQLSGSNTHHIAEAIFKAFGRALGMAVRRLKNNEVPSTKGMIE
ncbi:MAG: imidazoleglycerol-phosphate dehydratase HisB [bacterium]|jgi:imidazoleglycerol-phosphate dehydratase